MNKKELLELNEKRKEIFLNKKGQLTCPKKNCNCKEFKIYYNVYSDSPPHVEIVCQKCLVGSILRVDTDFFKFDIWGLKLLK